VFLRSIPTFLIVPIVSIVSMAPMAPRLSLWYRGQPAGVARAADLIAIRALGFTAITWPASQSAGAAEAARLASDAGLEFILRTPPVALTAAAARHPGSSVDLVTSAMAPASITPVVWRAIAHGARDVSFDPGADLERVLAARGTEPLWLPAIAEISRHLRINGRLLADAAPAVEQPTIDTPVPAAVDVVLLSAGRTWVLVATNTGGRVRVTAHLPAEVPYAIWLNLLNGDTLAMLSEPRGPRWSFDVEASGTRIYIIDKEMR
jgi:hypothetical protein